MPNDFFWYNQPNAKLKQKPEWFQNEKIKLDRHPLPFIHSYSVQRKHTMAQIIHNM